MRLTAVATDCATRDISLRDKTPQIIFRRIGVQWDFGPLQNPQQFCLASFQTRQEFVEIAIAGVDGKDPVESCFKSLGCALAGSSRKIFQKLVKEPAEPAQGFDMRHLLLRCRHQLVQQSFCMNPAQRMRTDTKLSSIIGDNDCIPGQPVMANSALDAGLCKWTNNVLVKNVDTVFGQIGEKRNLVGKPSWTRCPQARQKCGIHPTVFEKGEGSIVEDIVLIITTQQGQKVQPRLRRRCAKGGKILASYLGRMKIVVGMAGTCVVDRDKEGRDQASMQHRSILGMKAIQSLRQKVHDLTFGNLDANFVEQGRQPLCCDLPMAVRHQAEASQIGAVAASCSSRQWRNNHVGVVTLSYPGR